MKLIWALARIQVYSIEFLFAESGQDWFVTKYGPFTLLIKWLTDTQDRNRVFNTFDNIILTRL